MRRVGRVSSRLGPVALRSALTPPGTPHAGSPTNSSATATPDRATPAAQPTRGHAKNEGHRRSAEELIQQGRPGIAGRIGTGEKSGIRRSPFELSAPEAAAESIRRVEEFRSAHEIGPGARSLGRREGAKALRCHVVDMTGTDGYFGAPNLVRASDAHASMRHRDKRIGSRTGARGWENLDDHHGASNRGDGVRGSDLDRLTETHSAVRDAEGELPPGQSHRLTATVLSDREDREFPNGDHGFSAEEDSRQRAFAGVDLVVREKVVPEVEWLRRCRSAPRQRGLAQQHGDDALRRLCDGHSGQKHEDEGDRQSHLANPVLTHVCM